MRHSSSTTFQNHTVAALRGILPKRLLRCWPAGSSAPDTRQRHTHLPRRGYVTRTCRHNFSIPRVDRHAVTHTHPYQIRARARSQAHACLEHNCAYLYEGVDSRLAVPVPGPVTGLLLLWESRRRGRRATWRAYVTVRRLVYPPRMPCAKRFAHLQTKVATVQRAQPLLMSSFIWSGASPVQLLRGSKVSSRFRQGFVMVSSRCRHRFRSRLPLRIRAEPR